MEAHCSQPGERCCSLEVRENEIKELGYVEEGMLHVALRLNPKGVHPDLTKKLPAQQ